MYRRSKFLEVLLEIRQEMARDADYDVDLFAEMARSGSFGKTSTHSVTDAIQDRGPSQGTEDRVPSGRSRSR